MYCLRDVVKFGPLGYCKQCSAWYKEEGKAVEGVYEYCTTKDIEPEKCNEFVQNLIMRPRKAPDGGEIHIVQTGITQIREADTICAACEAKNFITD